MKKVISLLITVILVCTALCGCAQGKVYSYELNSYELGIWGGKALDDTVDSAQLVFDAKNKEITFTCDGVSLNGTLTQKSGQETGDLWRVEWDTAPEGSENYAFSYSAFMCSNDYSKASPFVQLLFFFDGTDDSLEAAFSMKHAG